MWYEIYTFYIVSNFRFVARLCRETLSMTSLFKSQVFLGYDLVNAVLSGVRFFFRSALASGVLRGFSRCAPNKPAAAPPGLFRFALALLIAKFGSPISICKNIVLKVYQFLIISKLLRTFVVARIKRLCRGATYNNVANGSADYLGYPRQSDTPFLSLLEICSFNYHNRHYLKKTNNIVYHNQK